MIEILAIGGLVAWTMMSYNDKSATASSASGAGKQTLGATGKLSSVVHNGFQFRDNMFSTMADYIGHPDVKNNWFALNRQRGAVVDPGIFGVERKTMQLYEGLSEPMQIYRQSNLVL